MWGKRAASNDISFGISSSSSAACTRLLTLRRCKTYTNGLKQAMVMDNSQSCKSYFGEG